MGPINAKDSKISQDLRKDKMFKPKFSAITMFIHFKRTFPISETGVELDSYFIFNFSSNFE